MADKDQSVFLKLILKIFFFFLFIQILGVPQFEAFAPYFPNFMQQYELPLLVGEVTLSVFLLHFLYSRYRNQLRIANPNHFGKEKLAGNKILFTVGMFVVMNIVAIVFSSFLSLDTPDNQEAINQATALVPMLAVFNTVVFGPLAEEIIFRGIFFNYFFNQNRRNSHILAIIVSGTVFGLMHEASFSLAFLYYASLGWILAGTYLYTKDLRYSMAIHLLFNLLGSL
ncbi:MULTISPECIES: CPBP family intramembrane glutamic endopeptidase [Enterococcus]|uniref:CPBP family intramembrane metalloprotease n=1 Tax=Enterococcus alishanensis TaxID=1303817 RepID=A0ABS6T9C9_9ENTE|nr:CPBP family intramembrane glutamic endopeptidase [Enterococcus alishanensis]MBV7389506.1 CPBP family intramembrane metalloprotease [Enterococcus alishanensis]